MENFDPFCEIHSFTYESVFRGTILLQPERLHLGISPKGCLLYTSYYVSGLKIDEAIERIKKDNLFQYPTERQVSRLARACYKRLDALGNDQLVHELASAPVSYTHLDVYKRQQVHRGLL